MLQTPPPPPPSLTAIKSYVPTILERGAGALRLQEGDHYYEKAWKGVHPFPGDWRYVCRLGVGRRQVGWARVDLLACTASQRPNICTEIFSPVIADWTTCVKRLTSIGGIWEDDRQKVSKIYNVTVFADEGIANVLTELKSGEVRRGRRLLQVRRLQNDIYTIMWTENFCLSADSNSKVLQWVPINPDKHKLWTWERRGARSIGLPLTKL